MTANRPERPIRLHGFSLSGHTHRVSLFLNLLDLPHEFIEVDLPGRANRSPEFLQRNAFGQVPVIEDGEVTLADSNAILVYLNARYAKDPARWLPPEPLAAARVQRWLSAAAGPLAFGPAAARVVVLFGRQVDPGEFIARARTLLEVMDLELATRPFLAGDGCTLADLANYSYVAHAPEGNVSLEPYANVRAWLARIEALPRFVPMVRSRIGLAA